MAFCPSSSVGSSKQAVPPTFTSRTPCRPSYLIPTTSTKRRPRHVIITASSSSSTSSLPESFDDMRSQATESVIRALQAEKKLIEVNFPPVGNMATAALNQLLDANRMYAKQLLLSLNVRLSPNNLYAIFPDDAEANLARKAYGSDVPFKISTLKKITSDVDINNDDGVLVLVQPGFNVDEWILMEDLEGLNVALVALNADLDKVRASSYYPRIFYPKLHQVRKRFLCRFEEIYYVKMFSNGGVLFKQFPSSWELFYSNTKSNESQVIWDGEERPEFRGVEKQLALAREKDMLSSK